MKKKLSLLLIALLFALSSCYNYPGGSSTSSQNSSSSSQQAAEKEIVEIYKSSQQPASTSLEETIAEIYDGVVVINAYTQTGVGAGAGVITGKSNKNTYYVTTCHHVIDGANSFKVNLADGTSYDASLVGGDPLNDIAVLEISESNELTVISYGDSSTLKIGQQAIAIGNPLGTLGNTVTSGIISATKRDITFSDGTTQELIQTDAAINSGNSGGGLFDSLGNLIGIVSAKYSAAGVEGLGFAIPINTAKEISNSLIENDGVVLGRYSLGVTFRDGTYLESFFSNPVSVVYVYAVSEDGCAYSLLKYNDIIKSVKIDYADTTLEDKTHTVSNASDLVSFIKDDSLKIGDTISFELSRNGNIITVNVELKQYKYTIN